MSARARASSTFNLQGYISQYEAKSETRIERLLFLIESGKADAEAAYRMLEEHLKKNRNWYRYNEIFGTVSDDNSMDVEMSSKIANEGTSKNDAQRIPISINEHYIQSYPYLYYSIEEK